MLAHLLRALQNCTVRATMPAFLELLLEQMSGADEQHDRKIAAVQALLCKNGLGATLLDSTGQSVVRRFARTACCYCVSFCRMALDGFASYMSMLTFTQDPIGLTSDGFGDLAVLLNA